VINKPLRQSCCHFFHRIIINQFFIHNDVENVYDSWSYLYKGPEISWSDDGRQPNKDEWLFQICFTCGAYIFGDSYPRETFDAFFAELKSFGPVYCDTNNNSLYFSEDKSKAVYEAFWPIFRKYQAMVKDEIKRQRKRELELELARLSEETK